MAIFDRPIASHRVPPQLGLSGFQLADASQLADAGLGWLAVGTRGQFMGRPTAFTRGPKDVTIVATSGNVTVNIVAQIDVSSFPFISISDDEIHPVLPTGETLTDAVLAGISGDVAGSVQVAADGKITWTGDTPVSGSITATATNADGIATELQANFRFPNVYAKVAPATKYVLPSGWGAFEKGTPIPTLQPTLLSGSAPTHFSVAPPLPNGLVLDASTGAISGTPTSIHGTASYRFMASNTGGSVEAVWDTAGTLNPTVTISVADRPPSLQAYTDRSLVFGEPMVPLAPTLEPSQGSATHFTVAPALPAGLGMDSITGIISGTPTAFVAASAYTVTAHNATATSAQTVNIDVLSTKHPDSVLSGTVGAALASTGIDSALGMTNYQVSTSGGIDWIGVTSEGKLTGTPNDFTRNGPVTVTITADVAGVQITVYVDVEVTTFSFTKTQANIAVAVLPTTDNLTGGTLLELIGDNNSAVTVSAAEGIVSWDQQNPVTGTIGGTSTNTTGEAVTVRGHFEFPNNYPTSS